MASVIERLQDRTRDTDERPRVLGLEEPAADDVLDALSPATRRHAYRALFDEPRTTSELAELLDTSVQNVQYHLGELTDVGLVEPVDTVYSSKGNEMTVYGPASDPIVFVGDESRYPLVERSVRRAVTGLAFLAAASLLVQWGLTQLLGTPGGGASGVGPAGYGTYEPAETITWVVFGVLEPGIVFFIACVVVAAVVVTLSER